MWRVTGLGRKLANNLATSVVMFPLKKRSLEVHVRKVPPPISRDLAKRSKSRSGAGWRIDLLVVFLPILESSKDPTCLALVKAAILLAFDREDPTTADQIASGDLVEVHKFINIIVKPTSNLGLLGLIELLRILSKLCGCGL